MYKVAKQILTTHEAILTVEFEDEVVTEEMKNAARRISQKANIPGFRKGHAPYNIVLRYVGESEILKDATETLLDQHYSKILEAAEVDPYSSGHLEDVNYAPLTLKIRVPLSPSVVFDDYQSVRAEIEDVVVTDAEVEQELDALRSEHATLEPVSRPAQLDDELSINYTACDPNTQEEQLNEEDISLVLGEDDPHISREFESMLVGMTAGEEKTFQLTLPEDYDQELGPATLEFHVVVVNVYEQTLPELNDAFASTVGAFETLDELKQEVVESLKHHKQHQAEDAYLEALVDQLVELAQIAYPPVLEEEEIDYSIKRIEQDTVRRFNMGLDDVLRLQRKTLEQYREEIRESVVTRIKRNLVLDHFSFQENITVTADDIIQRYTELRQTFGDQSNGVLDEKIALDSPLALSLAQDIRRGKAIERLKQIGRGEADAPTLQSEDQTAA